ncbi:hypothetical protein BH10ACI1_BH10ACI1_26470 [soil metagenome]
MDKKAIWLTILGVLLSFIGGFFLANALNKNELEMLRVENNRLKNSSNNSTIVESETNLSDEEINKKIAEADQNPNNLPFQKSLGTALYRYASMKEDAKILAESARILNRVYEKDSTDKEVAVMLGNSYFDIGYFQKNNENLLKARQIYQKILEQTPNDFDVRTDYGLTFYLQNPPDYEKAISELKKSLQDNPKHEKTLQFLVQILLKQGKTQEAETNLQKLKEINPNTPSLAEVQKQFEQSENANQK